MAEKNDSFYNIVKRWVENDYKTPDVKAEVLIDMLISEYINEIFDSYQGLPGEGSAFFISKEFPIKNYTDHTPKGKSDNSKHYMESGDNRSASVDFFVGKDDILYLTELKTDSNSFSDDQLIRMIMAKERGVDQLMEYYKKVLARTGKKNKRLYQFKQFAENTDLTEVASIKQLSNDADDFSFLDKLKSRFSRIEIIYILLDRKMIPTNSMITSRDYHVELNDGKQYQFCDLLKDYHMAEYGTMKYRNKISQEDNTIYVMELKSCKLHNKADTSWDYIKDIINGCLT